MRLNKFLILALSIALVVGVVFTDSCTPTQIIGDITPQDAITLIQNNQNNPDFIILDVRTPEEFTEEHIENATNLDFYSETFRNELNQLDKNKTYLVYCRSGNRSGKALNIMTELNFGEVYDVLGGIIAWNVEGLPTTK